MAEVSICIKEVTCWLPASILSPEQVDPLFFRAIAGEQTPPFLVVLDGAVQDGELELDSAKAEARDRIRKRGLQPAYILYEGEVDGIIGYAVYDAEHPMPPDPGNPGPGQYKVVEKGGWEGITFKEFEELDSLFFDAVNGIQHPPYEVAFSDTYLNMNEYHRETCLSLLKKRLSIAFILRQHRIIGVVGYRKL